MSASRYNYTDYLGQAYSLVQFVHRPRSTSEHSICLTRRPLSQTSSRNRILSRNRHRKRNHLPSNLRGRKRVRYLNRKVDLTERLFMRWFSKMRVNFFSMICNTNCVRWIKFETRRRREHGGNVLIETLRSLRLCVSTFTVPSELQKLPGSPNCLRTKPIYTKIQHEAI